VLLDDREAIWPLRSVVARSRTRPCLRAAATEALARLGDATAATAAAVRMAPQPGERVSLVESVLAVRAAGHLGAPACIDPLLAVLADDSQEGLVRACAAAALGHAIDQRPTPWTVRVALGADYRALDRILSNGRNGILDRF
jgi:HEAT repeat protein